ncbi:hypothetical protein TorRG33x02_100260 [Trema orientale]|uniref:Uncharacterized protein n=1 Tax=Trema orientale TaxID=63057 RepID=A0A2P5F939_TREOI|nr:hypothetical protein TorRG33x02_100260 [Trema orientale]
MKGHTAFGLLLNTFRSFTADSASDDDHAAYVGEEDESSDDEGMLCELIL